MQRKYTIAFTGEIILEDTETGKTLLLSEEESNLFFAEVYGMRPETVDEIIERRMKI